MRIKTASLLESRIKNQDLVGGNVYVFSLDLKFRAIRVLLNQDRFAVRIKNQDLVGGNVYVLIQDFKFREIRVKKNHLIKDALQLEFRNYMLPIVPQSMIDRNMN